MLRGANPAMEGKPAPASTVNEHGRPITDLIRDELRSSDNGVVAYLFPKPGHTELSRRSLMPPASRDGINCSLPAPTSMTSPSSSTLLCSVLL